MQIRIRTFALVHKTSSNSDMCTLKRFENKQAGVEVELWLVFGTYLVRNSVRICYHEVFRDLS